METLIIKVPEEKSTLIKQLLKELGVTVQDQPSMRQLAEKINKSIKPGPKPTMDEIVEEVKKFRAGQ